MARLDLYHGTISIVDVEEFFVKYMTKQTWVEGDKELLHYFVSERGIEYIPVKLATENFKAQIIDNLEVSSVATLEDYEDLDDCLITNINEYSINHYEAEGNGELLVHHENTLFIVDVSDWVYYESYQSSTNSYLCGVKALHERSKKAVVIAGSTAEDVRKSLDRIAAAQKEED